MAKTGRPRTHKKALAPKALRLPADLMKAVGAARGKKAADLMLLDLRKADAFTDYFLVCTGANPRQVHAIADAIEQALKAERVPPSHVEGYGRAEWILMDYFDFIVHVFSPAARAFYGLERLWGNAVRVELPEEPIASPA
jgi:ribosome-associated protein